MNKLKSITSAALLASNLIAPEVSAEEKTLTDYYEKIKERVKGEVCKAGSFEIVLSDEKGATLKSENIKWIDKDLNMIPEKKITTNPNRTKETTRLQDEKKTDTLISTEAMQQHAFYIQGLEFLSQNCKEPSHDIYERIQKNMNKTLCEYSWKDYDYKINLRDEKNGVILTKTHTSLNEKLEWVDKDRSMIPETLTSTVSDAVTKVTTITRIQSEKNSEKVLDSEESKKLDRDYQNLLFAFWGVCEQPLEAVTAN